jgi:hypothetical protein
MAETRAEEPRKGCIGVISIDHSDSTLLQTLDGAFALAGYLQPRRKLGRYWFPLPLRTIAPARLPRVRRAASIASTTSSSGIRLDGAQPTTLREPRSSTVAS